MSRQAKAASKVQEMREAEKHEWDSMSHERRYQHAEVAVARTLKDGELHDFQKLHIELIEDAIETQKGTAQLERKLRSSNLIPPLKEYMEELRRVRDELRFERQTADALAGLLRGTTRALLDASEESLRLVRERLPPTFAAVLSQWVREAQGKSIDVDTVFDELKTVRQNSSVDENKSTSNNGKHRHKRRRSDVLDDDDDDDGEDPSGGARNRTSDVDGPHHSSDEDKTPSTNVSPNNTTDALAPTSKITAEKTPTPDISQNDQALASAYARTQQLIPGQISREVNKVSNSTARSATPDSGIAAETSLTPDGQINKAPTPPLVDPQALHMEHSNLQSATLATLAPWIPRWVEVDAPGAPPMYWESSDSD